MCILIRYVYLCTFNKWVILVITSFVSISWFFPSTLARLGVYLNPILPSPIFSLEVLSQLS